MNNKFKVCDLLITTQVYKDGPGIFKVVNITIDRIYI